MIYELHREAEAELTSATLYYAKEYTHAVAHQRQAPDYWLGRV